MYRPQSYSFKYENSLTHQRSICSLPSVEPVKKQPTLVFYLAYRLETSSGMSGRQTLKTQPVIHRWPDKSILLWAWISLLSQIELLVDWTPCSFHLWQASLWGHTFLQAWGAEKGFTAEGIAGAKSRNMTVCEWLLYFVLCVLVCDPLYKCFIFTSFSMTHDPIVKRCAWFICVQWLSKMALTLFRSDIPGEDSLRSTPLQRTDSTSVEWSHPNAVSSSQFLLWDTSESTSFI